MSKQGLSKNRIFIAVAALVIGFIGNQLGVDLSALTSALSNSAGGSTQSAPAPAPGGTTFPGAPTAGDGGAGRIAQAVARKESGFMVTVDAQVKKTLPDDNKGSRHQRFLIELSSGHTLLVAHNIDLAKSVPLSRGDAVRVRGQFEWNEKGGVLHWTHHDPGKRREGGWIEFEGTRTE
ncbi:MAG: DUF3465 domain-containing protein [Myxococcota bacterium]